MGPGPTRFGSSGSPVFDETTNRLIGK